MKFISQNIDAFRHVLRRYKDRIHKKGVSNFVYRYVNCVVLEYHRHIMVSQIFELADIVQ